MADADGAAEGAGVGLWARSKGDAAAITPQARVEIKRLPFVFIVMMCCVLAVACISGDKWECRNEDETLVSAKGCRKLRSGIRICGYDSRWRFMKSSTLRLLGTLILFFGIAIGGIIYLRGMQEERRDQAQMENASEDSPLADQNSRRFAHDLAVYNGELGTIIDKWSEFWQHLSEPKTLGPAIAVVSLVAGTALLFAGSRLVRNEPG